MESCAWDRSISGVGGIYAGVTCLKAESVCKAHFAQQSLQPTLKAALLFGWRG
jgi:hypothetical protein